MKKTSLIKAMTTLLFAIPVMMMGQTITKEFETNPFTGVSAGGVFTVSLTQADEFSVKVETTEEQMEKVQVDVKKNVLTLNYDERVLRRVERITVYVSAPAYDKITASGDAAINGTNKFTSPKFDLRASGASNVRLDLEVEKLVSAISGAANATLKGSATLHEATVSGASYLKAYDMQTEKTVAIGSGASNMQVNATQDLEAVASGTASINYKQVPKNHNFSTSAAANITFKGDPADLEGTTLKEKYDKDTVRVRVGERDLLIITDEEGKKTRTVTRKARMRKNWSGIEMGMNGFMTPDYSLDLPADASYLELDYPRSLSVNLNLFQQNFRIIKNNLGVFTGFGFGFINYAFEKDITLIHEEDGISYTDGADDDTYPDSFRRNRLSLVNFHVPLMLEFQTSGRRQFEQFHLAAGVIGTAKLRSYTRQVYEFDGDRQRDNMIKSYHTRPFNLDATARIGWGRVNLFATYSLLPLFRDDKGPELHAFNMGIRLVNW